MAFKQIPVDRLESAGYRRSSTISDQALLRVDQRPPVLAETKQGMFSQTTDCVQLHEMAGPVCQQQQRLYTNNAVTRPLLMRGNRASPLCRVLQQSHGINSSIDEGVESECSEDQSGSRSCYPVPETESSQLDLKSESTQPVPVENIDIAVLNQTDGVASAESSIDLDMASNISLSLSSAGSYTAANMDSILSEISCLVEDETWEKVDERTDSDDQNQDHKDFVDFQQGRRASDGLAVHPPTAFCKKLKDSMKASGVLELRKELEKLQMEHGCDMDNTEAKKIKNRYPIRDQWSVEESWLRQALVKRRSLPSNAYNVWTLQKRLAYKRHGLLSPHHQSGNDGKLSSSVPGVDANQPQRSVSPLRAFPPSMKWVSQTRYINTTMNQNQNWLQQPHASRCGVWKCFNQTMACRSSSTVSLFRRRGQSWFGGRIFLPTSASSRGHTT